MGVRFTADVEKERVINIKAPTWELLRSVSIVQAIHFARDNGWKDKKVQVRVEITPSNTLEYIVEPYEEGCSCRGLLKYDTYYDRMEEN